MSPALIIYIIIILDNFIIIISIIFIISWRTIFTIIIYIVKVNPPSVGKALKNYII
jgi:hypothetical protein